MRHLLLARAARQPAAQEIGPERDHRTVRFDREAAPRRRLVAGWHGRPAGGRMSGETAPTAQARAERQEQTARWVDRPRRQRRSRSAAAGIACRPDLRPPAGRRHAIRDATPERLARTAHDGTLRCEPIRPGKDDRPYFEARLSEPAKSAFFRVRTISWSFCPYRAGSRGPLSLASPLRASRLPPPQRAAYLRAVRADRSGARRRHGYGGVDARSGRVRRYGDRLPPGIGGRAHRAASTPLRARISAKLPGRRGRRPGGARWRTRRPDRRQRRLHAS